MKKLLVVLLICLLGMGMAFANGAQETTPAKTTPAATPAKGKVQVQFWHSMGGRNGDLLNAVCKAFNDSHTDIEVVPSYQGDYWTAASKAIAAVSAGENPDIVMMGADHVSVFSKEDGVLADLIPYMKKSGIDPNDFIDAFSWDYKIDGKMIAIPFGRSMPVLFVNQDMMKAEGLEIPTNWDELKAVCDKLVTKDAKGEITRYGFAMPRDTWYFFMACAQAGGDFINADRTGMGCIENGNGLRAYTYMQNLHKDGDMFFGPVTDSGNACNQMFLEGKAAMLMTSVSALAGIEQAAKFNVKLAFIPQGKVRVVPTGGNSIVILESAKQKDAAWEFMRWALTDPQGILYFTQNTGYMPVTKTMANSPEEQALWNKMPNRKTAYEQLQYASDKGHRVPQGGAIMNELYTFIDAIMYDNEDVQKQLDSLASSIATIMKEK
jgi:sn-glycerol 3-phosphate transport system substrate-binding protein